jgi:hypothetical protein
MLNDIWVPNEIRTRYPAIGAGYIFVFSQYGGMYSKAINLFSTDCKWSEKISATWFDKFSAIQLPYNIFAHLFKRKVIRSIHL